MTANLTPKQKEFVNDLQAIVAKHLKSHDEEMFSLMLERLSVSLGLVISVASSGDKESITTLIQGCEGYVYEEALKFSKFAEFMSPYLRGNK